MTSLTVFWRKGVDSNLDGPQRHYPEWLVCTKVSTPYSPSPTPPPPPLIANTLDSVPYDSKDKLAKRSTPGDFSFVAGYEEWQSLRQCFLNSIFIIPDLQDTHFHVRACVRTYTHTHVSQMSAFSWYGVPASMTQFQRWKRETHLSCARMRWGRW